MKTYTMYSFEQIGKEMGCDEVYAASIFYGQVKK
jgi:cyanate lyase